LPARQSNTIATSSTVSLFGEPGEQLNSTVEGLGSTAPCFRPKQSRRRSHDLRVHPFTIRHGFRHHSDPIAFIRSTLSASPQLTQTELGGHLKVAYFMNVRDKMDVVLAVGPSFIRLERDIASATIVDGAAQITVDTERGNAWGAHGSVDVNYLFTPQLGGGVFVRYIAAQADLPARHACVEVRFRPGWVCACGSSAMVFS
jgi:hypothetical protein